MSRIDKNKPGIKSLYPFREGILHTPFMIFVRSYNAVSDEEFMTLLGVQDYEKKPPPIPFLGSHVVFANDEEWTHIADDFGYKLWRDKNTSKVIQELAGRYDVFRCSIGDIDESFEFEFYQGGSLKRKFVYEHDVFYKTRLVTVDEGEKLLGEPEKFDHFIYNSTLMFPELTQALGIVRVMDPFQNRFYCKLKEV